MYKYVCTVFTSDKSVTFFCVEPFYSSLVHVVTSIKNKNVHIGKFAEALENLISEL